MNVTQKSIKNYESISEEVKHLTNSLVRLKILAILYEQPLNMKGINKTTGLSYSSISSNMVSLELEEYIYREGNFYFISNVAKFYISNILELNHTIKLLNKFFNILDAHIVDIIPEESVAELYLLGNAVLIESTDKDIYKVYNIIKCALEEACCLKCVLPVVHDDFNKCINDLIDGDNIVEILVPNNIEDNFKNFLNLGKDCIDLATFNNDYNFLLVVTDKIMILGLFREDGNFDQNRIITSKKEDSVKWGENLFENFKNKISK